MTVTTQQLSEFDGQEDHRTHVSSPPLPEDSHAKSRKNLRHFVTWERKDQLRVFLEWLPQELHDAPGIDWTSLDPPVMGYCVRSVGRSLDAPYLAIAAASMSGAVTRGTVIHQLSALNTFFQTLRQFCKMEQVSDLKHERIWNDLATKTTVTYRRKQQLKAYMTISTGHIPSYLQRLDSKARLRMQSYALPLMPPRFVRQYGGEVSLAATSQAKRKAQSDILVPLYPVLRQLVRLRKQLMERTLQTIREAQRRVDVGEAELPFHFEHIDILPEVNRDAKTISEVEIRGREVTMHFVLWNKRTWALQHADRFKFHSTAWQAKKGLGAYSPELNTYFVQFVGDPADMLWFGDLLQHRAFQHFKKLRHPDEEYDKRWKWARRMGFTTGCYSTRPEVLACGDRWFSDNVHQDNDFLFEPESLYRGVLMAATLAMISLSNGSRVSELLQVSFDRRITRTETVVVLDEQGRPCMRPDGLPQTKQMKIHLQHLLPKGAKTDEERQLYPLSKECMRLLGEIKALLVSVHGEIPVVHPSRSSLKYEQLQPERYFFQWAASADGKQGIFGIHDVQILLRFILHGLDLYTAQGEPIRVTAHILRHVMATHARHYRHVPSEVIAHFFLHHRLKSLTGREPSPSEISEYYTLMPEQQRFAAISADLDEQEEMDRALLYSAPSLRDLEQMNEDLRAVYEQWQTLHPTAFGNCGCPGLCPRGTDRSLCLGCSYHVEDPEKLGAVLVWRASYAKQAELLELQGNLIDARQARIKVQQLDDMINVMRMQLQEEVAGRYIPVFKVLPSPYHQTEEDHEKED